MRRTCATCAKSDTCFYASDKTVECTKHEPRPESNYEKLFGTPERAARTLEKAQLEIWDYCEMVDSRCDECRYEFDRYGCCNPTPLLKWLRGDA